MSFAYTYKLSILRILKLIVFYIYYIRGFKTKVMSFIVFNHCTVSRQNNV